MCGESHNVCTLSEMSKGSPPHVWGKPVFSVWLALSKGITPTCVGKARSKRTKVIIPTGSPPHVWGKLKMECINANMVRITPTCVGKANLGIYFVQSGQDHPHMCGESNSTHFFETHQRGSPPHVWGKPPGNTCHQIFYRITPTCVGKASCPPFSPPLARDHPHMCGESYPCTCSTPCTQGSPPHVWGKLTGTQAAEKFDRITPTCVGKAVLNAIISAPNRDHPHLCGESTSIPAFFAPLIGSPPHVWGKPARFDVYTATLRITPPCVGKAAIISRSFPLLRDHPHMCGESLPTNWEQARHVGSPPHVWGKQLPNRRKRCHRRITPTCVGKADGRL